MDSDIIDQIYEKSGNTLAFNSLVLCLTPQKTVGDNTGSEQAWEVQDIVLISFGFWIVESLPWLNFLEGFLTYPKNLVVFFAYKLKRKYFTHYFSLFLPFLFFTKPQAISHHSFYVLNEHLPLYISKILFMFDEFFYHLRLYQL